MSAKVKPMDSIWGIKRNNTSICSTVPSTATTTCDPNCRGSVRTRGILLTSSQQPLRSLQELLWKWSPISHPFGLLHTCGFPLKEPLLLPYFQVLSRFYEDLRDLSIHLPWSTGAYPRESTVLVYQPFTTTDILNWKNHAPSTGSDWLSAIDHPGHWLTWTNC